MLVYLGATAEQLADFDDSHRRWGQGAIQITLQPCRKNLLRIDYSDPPLAISRPPAGKDADVRRAFSRKHANTTVIKVAIEDDKSVR